MKKVLIALLAVLLLLSFTSCEKDKSEDVIAAYEEFISVNDICSDAARMLNNAEVVKDNTVYDYYIVSLVKAINGIDIEIKSNKITSGSKDSTSEGDVDTNTYSDVVIEYTYTEGSDTTEKTGTLTVSGTYVSESPNIRAQAAYSDVSYELTINGTKYKLSYYRDSYGKYERASVNGKDVEVRLLNSSLDHEYA
jgi:hypothetical protein